MNLDHVTLQNNTEFKPCMKKPIVVHAMQILIPEGFEVTTMEGELHGNCGDYLMVGVRGEKYPIAKEVFEETYDILPEGAGQ